MNRINIITLGIKNIMQSYEFFKRIGFDATINETEPSIIFFKNEGSRLALYPIKELARDIGLSSPPTSTTSFSGITLAYNAKSAREVDDIILKTKEAGAKIIKEPQPTDWGGYGGYFIDLDGYYWEVAYGDAWKFDECNMLIL